jgi:hypothetical protein
MMICLRDMVAFYRCLSSGQVAHTYSRVPEEGLLYPVSVTHVNGSRPTLSDVPVPIKFIDHLLALVALVDVIYIFDVVACHLVHHDN